MKVLIIGSGGREHALGWKINKSPLVKDIFFSPGNAGTSSLGKNVNPDDLVEFCQKEGVQLTVVGPEAPLAEGVVDKFEAAGLKIFGPSKKAAQLESSKAYAKEVMQKAGVPTAGSETFESLAEAEKYIEQSSQRLVVKADGLAAGKGVIVCQDKEEALQGVRDCLEGGAFGGAGSRVVIEDFLEGEEASAMAIICGDTIIPLTLSQDYKRIFNGQTGPNTGGMGAISPTPVLSEGRLPEIVDTVFRPVVEELKSRGIFYKGFLYAGLMISPEGEINVLEFNCRLGDPETQVIMVRTTDDIVPVLLAAAENNLSDASLKVSSDAAVCVVASSKGYPGKVEDNKKLEINSDELVFLAGVREENGELFTNGGRVLAVVGTGKDVAEARSKAYKAMEGVSFEGMHFRTDIGS